ncbi:hypothetical protein [Nocardioides panaciterrulae]|uniref:Tetratricopeptide (TPR) repeat protein n=1 Tax=Nocardioides panaciterrulae TaxID=661492 RepID=A0A7Y9E8M5_9ACTN|nr:hypothetical protein [Nocardioides panaciterrulae]NYD43249.1 tetratricopeptide (TPR) repeat protein [Nocardioides panaciterrulae]
MDEMLDELLAMATDHTGEAYENLNPVLTPRLDAALEALGQQLSEAREAGVPARSGDLLHPLFEARAIRDADGLDVLGDWLDRYGECLTPFRKYRLANRIAWITRGANTDLPPSVDRASDRFRLHVALMRKRFVFDVEAMARMFRHVQIDPEQTDAVIRALDAFCDIRQTQDAAEAAAAVEAALSAHDVREFEDAVYDIVAHAVWLNFELERQGEVLQDVCERAITYSGRASSVILFRYATALRLQGDYEAAIRKVESALAKLHGSTEFVRTFSEQCVRERELSVAGLSMRRDRDRVEQDLLDVRDEVGDIERRSIARMIEVIGLFTAVAAFAFGGGSIAAHAGSTPRETLVVLGGFGSALVTFSLVVVVVTHLSMGGSWSARRLIALCAAVVAAAAAQFGLMIAVSHVAF